MSSERWKSSSRHPCLDKVLRVPCTLLDRLSRRMELKATPLFMVLFLIFGILAIAYAGQERQEVYGLINRTLNNSTSTRQKIQYLVFRARWHTQADDHKAALADYARAIELEDKPWIRLERSRLLLRLKLYERAMEDAIFAKTSLPPLTREADQIIQEAFTNLDNKLKEMYPPTIIIDTRADPHRRSRFNTTAGRKR